MMVQNEHSTNARPLLGLRPPAELAEGMMTGATGHGTAADTPVHPSYGRISSGYDSEEDSAKGGGDLVAALRALAVLVVFIGVVAFLMR
jgi:hypothetical protein